MHRITYFFDAYCGWCYAASPALRALAEADDVDINVVHGALFAGDRAAPIREYAHIPAANERIAALTGAQFGQPYEELLASGTLVLDSDDAARGLAALQEVAGPERDLELAAAMQSAFYVDGLSLSEVGTYQVLAERLGLDAGSVVGALSSATAAERAAEAQRYARQLGVDHYPTLAVETERGLVAFGSPTLGVAALRAEMERARG